MQRRTFLKAAASAAAAPWFVNAGLMPRAARAAATPRIVVNVSLIGGADLRYLFVPDPTAHASYVSAFWPARRPLYTTSTSATFSTTFNNDYRRVTLNGKPFGVHKNAGWLIDRINAGKVAIIANVLGSENRAHDWSQLIWNSGDPTVAQGDYGHAGWGGRLAYAIGAATVVNVTGVHTVFANGNDPNDLNAKTIDLGDSRAFSLAEPTGPSSGAVVGRGLKAYYAAKSTEVASKPANWPYFAVLDHEARLRSLGQAYDAWLAEVAPTRPQALTNLYAGTYGVKLNNAGFGSQCANLYDAVLTADILDMRVAFMQHASWDTHYSQLTSINDNISDVFGSAKGLDTLVSELSKEGINDQLVYVINTEFGRQLAANSQRGTDHGRGNYTIIINGTVRPDIYGEMFPASESTGGAGKTKFDQPDSDIKGLTSMQRVLGEVCNWAKAGSAGTVFPGYSSTPIEPGVDLGSLFR